MNTIIKYGAAVALTGALALAAVTPSEARAAAMRRLRSVSA